MKKWEYIVATVPDGGGHFITEYLDSHGEEGWELVTVAGGYLYLKREEGE